MQKKILVGWEQGHGRGHLEVLQPLILQLKQTGHFVAAHLRELPANQTASSTWQQLPAWFYGKHVLPHIKEPTICFADVLWNHTFRDPQHAARRLSYWQKLLEKLQPNFVLCDYSLPLQLVSTARGIPTARIGSGFCCPPPNVDQQPLPAGINSSRQERRQRSFDSLTRINQSLELVNLQRRSSWEEVFACDETFLTYWPELDHFQRDTKTTYTGPVLSTGGNLPVWPSVGGAKVFVYLRPYPELGRLLEYLQIVGLRVLMHLPMPISQVLQESIQLHITPEKLDMSCVASEADFAITNGGLGITSHFLAAGKPLVALPTFQEQGLLGQKLQRQKLGELGYLQDFNSIISAVRKIMLDRSYRERAATFANYYAQRSQDSIKVSICERIAAMAS